MIGLTTGRQTSQRLNTILKELAHTLPHARIFRRGKSSLGELAQRLFESNSDYGLILQRWHGGPGRIDFFTVQPDKLTPLPPSLVLGGVRLQREFPKQPRHVVRGITCEARASESLRNLARSLSQILELPETPLHLDPETKATLQVSKLPNGMVRISVASLRELCETGPSLDVARVIWDLHA